MKEGCFLIGSTLEYVTIPKGCVIFECKNTGNRVQLQGAVDPSNQSFGKGGDQSLSIDKFNNFDSEKFIDENGPSKISWDNANGYATTDTTINHSWK